MASDKPRVIKDFEKLDKAIQEQIKLTYPLGFSKHLIHFTNKDGKKVSALPFETDDRYYLVRMTVEEARDIIRQDEDYDEFGSLRDDVKEEYEDKYSELDYMPDSIEGEMDEEEDNY